VTCGSKPVISADFVTAGKLVTRTVAFMSAGVKKLDMTSPLSATAMADKEIRDEIICDATDRCAAPLAPIVSHVSADQVSAQHRKSAI
jgi:hypothetical protein